MIIYPFDDKYKVTWFGHITRALDIEKWCHESFGSGWGSVGKGDPNRDDCVHCIFTFHRLTHAQWFVLKFNKT